MMRDDDVFREEFLEGVVFQVVDDDDDDASLVTMGGEKKPPLPVESIELLKSRRNLWYEFIPGHNYGLGPCVLVEGVLWSAFRLHDDIQGAFLASLVPMGNNSSISDDDDDGLYQNLRITGQNYQTLSVAVPPRTFGRQDKPLQGLRIAVKDLYRLKGLKTSLCNRAYYDLSPPSESTASIVQMLTDAGAQVLGVTKLSSLISREEPTEAVDYQAPFNPRGDGYQSPAGSSSGSAAAVAAYDWLDFAIGTDTSGSGRRPALFNGVFQMRPTHDAVSLDGMIPTFLPWDTPCLFGRDLTKFKGVIQHWYTSKTLLRDKFPSKRPSIIYPLDYLPVGNPHQMKLIDSFVNDLESYLGTDAVKVSIASLWDKSPPSEAQGQPVRDYLQDVVIHTYYRDFYHSTDDFRVSYWKKHQKKPYVNSFVHWRWTLGEQVTDLQYKEGMHRLEVYKRWFLDNVMHQEAKESFLVLPISKVEPDYRDIPPGEPTPQSGFDDLFIPPILGSPDVAIPIGEWAYESRISGREEFLPVVVDLVGSPGSDVILLDTIQKFLKSSGRATLVKTGSRIW
ncbi:MAG: hypothetical protein M1834_003266 [Cirrosporium novae-zelandiae]|nr:MAG: hypothetical protein M1834_003266 [Cirrosporium novae-zelandiae]